MASRRSKEIPLEEFLARHEQERVALESLFPSDPSGANTLAKGLDPRPSLSPQMNALKQHPLFKLLAAARENCPEAYETYLFVWLCRMGVPPPEGLFRGMSGKPGRAREPQTSSIYQKWIEIGEPPLSIRKLAQAFYGAVFTRASSADRKRMVDRCRRAVERRQAQLRPNPR